MAGRALDDDIRGKRKRVGGEDGGAMGGDGLGLQWVGRRGFGGEVLGGGGAGTAVGWGTVGWAATDLDSLQGARGGFAGGAEEKKCPHSPFIRPFATRSSPSTPGRSSFLMAASRAVAKSSPAAPEDGGTRRGRWRSGERVGAWTATGARQRRPERRVGRRWVGRRWVGERWTGKRWAGKWWAGKRLWMATRRAGSFTAGAEGKKSPHSPFIRPFATRSSPSTPG